MSTVAETRTVATSLPAVEDTSTELTLAFDVQKKGFAWSWKERIDPRKARVPNLNVLAVRCTPEEKEGMLATEPDKYFTEPHYNGYPAILVRLDNVTEAELRTLFTRAVELVTNAKPARKRVRG